jgi:hypothetical protein
VVPLLNVSICVSRYLETRNLMVWSFDDRIVVISTVIALLGLV